jgi:hypothetical protein
MVPGYSYVSLDLPSIAASTESDPDQFFARNPPPPIVDEAQYAPGLFRHLKAGIDADRHAMRATARRDGCRQGGRYDDEDYCRMGTGARGLEPDTAPRHRARANG